MPAPTDRDTRERDDTREREELAGAPDEEVVARAAAGDQRAWRELVRRYGGRLRAIALGLRLSPGDAEDAMQMTWLGLFRNLGALQARNKVGGWLCTTMRRNCLRLIQARVRERPVDGALLSDARLGAGDGPGAAPGVDLAMLVAERNRALWEAVGSLPDRQAALVRALFDDDERPYHRIAADLSIPIGTIGPIRQRALRRLARLLADAGMRRDELRLSA